MDRFRGERRFWFGGGGRTWNKGQRVGSHGVGGFKYWGKNCGGGVGRKLGDGRLKGVRSLGR
jgi:hypothetical protein